MKGQDEQNQERKTHKLSWFSGPHWDNRTSEKLDQHRQKHGTFFTLYEHKFVFLFAALLYMKPGMSSD